MGVRTGIITNADGRIRDVFRSIAADGVQYPQWQGNCHSPFGMNPFLISEEFGCEKPDSRIFKAAARLAGVRSSEAVHVGDELSA
jgi:hypothetical protein